MTVRALALSLLNLKPTQIIHPVDCDDTQSMLTACRALGARIETSAAAWRVVPAEAGPVDEEIEVSAGESGASARFLCAILAARPGRYLLTGGKGLRKRPMDTLVDALRSLGADIEYRDQPGHLPLAVHGKRLHGGALTLNATVSSQYASALLLAAPLFDGPLALKTSGVSQPYVRMTIAMLQVAGLAVTSQGDTYQVSPQRIEHDLSIAIEADASAAANFFALAALLNTSIHVSGLAASSLQGDLRMLEFLRQMGGSYSYDSNGVLFKSGDLRGLHADLSQCPDLAPALACLCSQAKGPSVLTGLAHLRFKESDRLAALSAELKRCGIDATVENDGLRILPGRLRAARVQCYDDHRIAMAFALLAVLEPGIELDDPACVAKSYPDFFNDLRAVLGTRSTQ